MNVIIDRCNFDATQRGHWIQLAQQYNADLIAAVLLPEYNNVTICSSRAFMRGDDGIHDADTDWMGVCNRMFNEFQYPSVEEGLTDIYQCDNQEEVEILIDLIANIH